MTPAHLLDARHRALTVGLLLGVVAVAFETMAVATVLPRVGTTLGNLTLYGWAFSAFLLSSIVGTVLAGHLADRRGPALTYAAGLVVFALGLAVAAAAPSMPVFVLGRFLQGFGAGALGALPFAVINTLYPPELRARMLAAVATAWVMPSLLGPLAASLLADALSWRAVFWGLLPLLFVFGPLAVVAIARRGRHVPPAQRERSPLLPAVQLAAGAGLLLEGLRQGSGWGAVLIVLGAALAAHAMRRLFPPGVWTARPGLSAALAVRGAVAFAFFGTEAYLPLSLNEVRGLSLTQAGLLLSVGGVTWSVGSWLQSRVEAARGPASRRGRVRSGVALVTLGLALAGLGSTGVWPVWVAYLGWLACGFGMGLGYSSNSLVALSFAGEGTSGRVSAQLGSIEVLAAAVAAGVGGAVIANAAGLLPGEHGLAGALAAVFALMVLASLLPWLAAARLPR